MLLAKYIKSANKYKDLAGIQTCGEICFFGRSNVGKSSLINTLFGKNLAFTSKTAGKTVSLNLYSFEKYTIVDSPGYGFAKNNMQESWTMLIDDYFANRIELKFCYILLDARRGILPIDFDMIRYISSFGRDFALVYTKIDKLTKKELEILTKTSTEAFDGIDIFYTSHLKNTGIKTLFGHILSTLKYNDK